MSKYSRYEYRQVKAKEWEIHPVWRGIGCILAILVPIMSYSAAILLVRENIKYKWVEVPAELAGWVDFSPVYKVLPSLRPFFLSLGRIYHLDMLVTFALVIIGFGILSTVYSIMYRSTGAKRYSSLDAPPIRKSPRRRVR